MNKRLFQGFIVSLFVFTLFISISTADVIESGVTYSNGSLMLSTSLSEIGDYSKATAVSIVKNYINDKTTYQSEFDSLYTAVKEKYNVDSYFVYLISSNRYGVIFYNSSLHEIYVARNGDTLVFPGILGYRVDTKKTLVSIQEAGSTGKLMKAGYLNDVKTAYSTNDSYLENFFYEISDNVSNVKILDVTNANPAAGYNSTWDGISYYMQSEPEPEVPEVPELTGEEMKAMIDKLQASDDYNKMLPRGYGDFFIVYNHIVNNYYAYVYPTKFSLAYRYYDWIEEQERYMANGQTSGDAISFMQYDEFDGLSFQQLWDNWNTLLNSFNPFDYYCFRLSSNGETFLYSTQYDSSQSGTSKFYFATNEESIVYSSKRLYLLINDGVLGTDFDVENTIDKTIITDSSGNEIEVTVQETEGEENFWISLINKVIAPIKEFLAAFKEANNIGLRFSPFLSGTEFNSTGIYILFLMLDVFLASFALVTRFAVFVFSLPTIEATSSLLPASVVQGLEWFKALNWNGLSFWVLFESFVLAISAVFVVRIVRRFYRL